MAEQVSERAARYLKQHAELFGSELPLDVVLSRKKKLTANGSAPVDLQAYYDEIKNCQLCSLGATRTKFVFGVGNPTADLMLVGEAPGRDEDLKGEPFVGRAGKLLDKILAAIDLTRDEVYIANVLKCRPPNNRDPLKTESDTCKPYLQKQIEMIKPKIILALGKVSGVWLTGEDIALGAMRERSFRYENIELMVTYHPAALLRNPNWKKPCWEDMKKVRDRLKELTTGTA